MTKVALLGQEDLFAILGRRRGTAGRAGIEDGEQDYRGENGQRKADRLLHGFSLSPEIVGSDGHHLNTGT
jgi:hypothetical protein